MKTPRIFMPGKDLEPKIKQLSESPKLPQPEERYQTVIERIERKDDKSYDFLLTDSEIFAVLERLPVRDVEGLAKIIITMPSRNEHFKLFGRYEKLSRTNGMIYLFKHLRITDGFVIDSRHKTEFVIDLGYKTVVYGPEEFKIENYKTLLHEIGHHVGIKDFDNDTQDFADGYMVKRYREIGDRFR